MTELVQQIHPAVQGGALGAHHWGAARSLLRYPRFKVRHLVIRPGSSLCLETHLHRAERWVVVAGAGRATIGTQQRDLFEGHSVDIPLGQYHGVTNHGKVDLHLIEIQTGICLDDDIEMASDKAG